MSLASEYRNAIRNDFHLARETVWPILTTPVNLGDIGRTSNDGFRRTLEYTDLPIAPKPGRPSGSASLELNKNTNVTGSIAVDGGTLKPGESATFSTTLTFNSSTSFYFFTPAYRQVEIEGGPLAFGRQVWDAEPHRYLLGDNVVYRVFRAETGLLVGTNTKGVTLGLSATYTKALQGTITGSFAVNHSSGSVFMHEYNGDSESLGVFAIDIFRWRPGGVVIVNPS